jgi:type I restriction enzyme M protein
MPSKRQVLDFLARNELLGIAERYELEVPDRRVREQLVDAAASSRRVVLADVLGGLTRDRLKELCRALGLDDSGKEKAALVDRIVGGKVVAEVAPISTWNGATRLEQVDLALGEKLTTEKLEGYLWSAADILRGSIDSSDYKGFIFGLLFLKRLSDRFDEECDALRSQPNADPDDPDEHDFFVPKRARWPEIQRVAVGVGEALNKACAELEQKNDKLEGVLAGIDFNDERKLGDAKNRDSVLSRLVQHFSRLDLRNANLSEPDLLGRAYEYLIEKFADDAGKKGGEFYTPRMVVRLIVEILQPAPGMRICDPTCGSGGMLVECAHYLERHGQNPRNLSLYGQEKNLGTWNEARFRRAARRSAGRRRRAPRVRVRVSAYRRRYWASWLHHTPQSRVTPPSTASVWPVMKPAASEVRNETTPIRSSGTPTRLTAWAVRVASKSPISCCGPDKVPGVRTMPGAIALTVIPY